jgi:tetratricopeptide (TPR) repeat protein
MKSCHYLVYIIILCISLCGCGKGDERHYDLAMRYKESGDYDKAIAELQAALKINPAYEKAHNQLGILYTKVGLYEKAVEECKKAVEIDENFGGAYYNLGVLYQSHLNKPVEAVLAYRRYLELKPEGSRAEAVRRIVQGLLQEPEVRGAMQETATVRFEVAEGYKAKGEYEKAIEEYKKAIGKGPDSSAHARIEIATIYDEKLDNPEEALKYYQAYLDNHLNASNAPDIMARVGKLRERMAVEPTPEVLPPDRLKEARELIDKKEYKRAMGLLRHAADASPDNEQVHELLAEAFMGSGDLMGAEKEYEWLRANAADFAYKKELLSIYLTRGDSYLEKADYRKAEEEFVKAVEFQPGDGSLRWKLAVALAGRGDFQKALQEAKEARATLPGGISEQNMSELYLKYARSLSGRNQYEKALEAFKRAKSLQPGLDLTTDMADFAERRARFAQGEGKLASAEKDYLNALKLDPDRWKVHEELALIYEKTGQYDKALDEFQKIINSGKGNASIYKEIAKIYEDYKEDNAQAVAYYRKYLKADPKAKDAKEIEEKLKESEEEKERIVEYKRAVERRPEHSTSHYNLAVLLQRQGKFKDAIGEYLKALAIDQNNAQAYFNLGYSYDKLKMYDRAIRAYRMAIMYKPDYVKAYNNLAAAYKEKGWHGKAITAFSKALEIDPDYAQAHLGLASIYANELKNRQKAIYHYKQYLKLQPQGPYAPQVRAWLGGSR